MKKIMMFVGKTKREFKLETVSDNSISILMMSIDPQSQIDRIEMSLESVRELVHSRGLDFDPNLEVESHGVGIKIASV